MNRVANQPLARALSDAPDAVRDRILENMSPRRSRLVAEEGEFMGELEAEEILTDQRDILETLRRLYDEGVISTYFGSVRGGESTVPEDDAEEEDDLDLPEAEESEPELGARPATPESRRPPIVVAILAGTGLLALLLLVISQLGEGGGSRGGSGARPKRPLAAGNKLQGQVLVQSGSVDTQAVAQSNADGSGDDAAPAGQVSAVLEFAGKSGQTAAQVRVEEGSRLEDEDVAVDSAGTSSDDELYLRLGRVSCAVVSETDTFVVRSPLVAVRGLPGAVFAVRVVLDASTTVFVERGRVEVDAEGGGQERPVVLKAGERRRFEP